MCMLAAIAGIFTSDCDKCVWVAVCLNTSVINLKAPTPLALDILFVSVSSLHALLLRVRIIRCHILNLQKTALLL